MAVSGTATVDITVVLQSLLKQAAPEIDPLEFLRKVYTLVAVSVT